MSVLYFSGFLLVNLMREKAIDECGLKKAIAYIANVGRVHYITTSAINRILLEGERERERKNNK